MYPAIQTATATATALSVVLHRAICILHSLRAYHLVHPTRFAFPAPPYTNRGRINSSTLCSPYVSSYDKCKERDLPSRWRRLRGYGLSEEARATVPSTAPVSLAFRTSPSFPGSVSCAPPRHGAGEILSSVPVPVLTNLETSSPKPISHPREAELELKNPKRSSGVDETEADDTTVAKKQDAGMDVVDV
ncbi:hypothetical protein B0H13DRAFT_2348922 [Mycena leptocephala]|nr:hypothetical protein B0H13DRAFT_2348922 [Mycena leptocephala]